MPSNVWKNFKRFGKQASKWRITLSFQLVTVEATQHWQPSKIQIKCRSGSQKHPTTWVSWQPKVTDPYTGEAEWSAPYNIDTVVTLFRLANSPIFDKKYWKITVVGHDKNSNSKVKEMGIAYIDLSKHVQPSRPVQQKLKIKLDTKRSICPHASIDLTISTALITEGIATEDDLRSVASSECSKYNQNDDIATVSDLNEEDELQELNSTENSDKMKKMLSDINSLVNPIAEINDENIPNNIKISTPIKVSPPTNLYIKKVSANTTVPKSFVPTLPTQNFNDATVNTPVLVFDDHMDLDEIKRRIELSPETDLNNQFDDTDDIERELVEIGQDVDKKLKTIDIEEKMITNLDQNIESPINETKSINNEIKLSQNNLPNVLPAINSKLETHVDEKNSIDFDSHVRSHGKNSDFKCNDENLDIKEWISPILLKFGMTIPTLTLNDWKDGRVLFTISRYYFPEVVTNIQAPISLNKVIELLYKTGKVDKPNSNWINDTESLINYLRKAKVSLDSELNRKKDLLLRARELMTKAKQENKLLQVQQEMSLEEERAQLEQEQLRMDSKLLEMQQQIREAELNDEDTDDLTSAHIQFINAKNALLRRIELLDLQERAGHLNDRYSTIDRKLRQLSDLQDWQKNEEQRKREETLLEELVEVVNERDELMKRIDNHEQETVEDESVGRNLNTGLYKDKSQHDKCKMM